MNRFYASMVAFVLAVFVASQSLAGNQITGYDQWTAYTPTISWTTNTTTVAAYRLSGGGTMDIAVKMTLSGAPDNATLTFELPAGWERDSTYIQDYAIIGTAALADTGSKVVIGYADASAGDLDQVTACYAYAPSAVPVETWRATVRQTFPFTWANTDTITIFVYGLPVVPE